VLLSSRRSGDPFRVPPLYCQVDVIDFWSVTCSVAGAKPDVDLTLESRPREYITAGGWPLKYLLQGDMVLAAPTLGMDSSGDEPKRFRRRLGWIIM
jgi:hypothetical protein